MSLGSLDVIRPGLQTIVVAAPRVGYRAIGVAPGGALDARAFALANALAGNAPGTPALEIAYGCFSARFAHPTCLALTGANCDARFDGVHLVLEAPRDGVRTYLAVRGGFDIPLVLGSQTTDLRGNFGGWHGRALRAGDVLPIGDSLESEAMLEDATTALASEVLVRAIDRGAPAEFWARPWRTSHESNRMGTRLLGEALQGGGDVDSHAVFAGVVQLPSGGEPIVLLADAQTTGGYRA
ncbi:MAG TPA: biotin-dependent carboxyltransferase family protein, partial [Candidatus Baltobacteraceae bacterium]|nr:biotin-dependent carboxyltransferase family protein [Candidatus Baltobacteraceae bacterium]